MPTCKSTSLRCDNFNTGEFLYLERYQIYKIHVGLHNASIMLLKQEFKFIKHQSRLCTYKKNHMNQIVHGPVFFVESRRMIMQ